jgi:hypothetical protein
MRVRFLAATLPAVLTIAEPARVADPIMPLSQVRPGMQCTGLTVVRGTDITEFAVEVLDVVDGEATSGGPRILVRASGPAVDDTGLGAGFSGSPILCPDADGVRRTVGAISEGVGEYGGKVALAMPIEAVLGTPVDPPRPRASTTAATSIDKRRPRDAATPARRVDAPRHRHPVLHGARVWPLLSPLTIGGLSPALGARLEQAAARRGRVVLAAPAGPLGSFPLQPLRPGAAFGASYSSGDVRLGAIGTVTYVDGSSVWGFGHPFEALGARSLFLQDAYIFRVVTNPVHIPEAPTTYKLAATGHDVGTLTNDALSAVAGRLGALPATVPVRIRAVDVDRDAAETLSIAVADESAVDQPPGISAISFVAPLAVSQGAMAVMRGSPARLTGTACAEITLREADEPLRFCNRYVTDGTDLSEAGNSVGNLAASDVLTAVGLVDGYKLGRIHVTGVTARVSIARGQRLAFLRGVRLPRRVRAGQRIRATLELRHVRGSLERRRVTLRMPRRLEPGLRRIQLTGVGVDFGGDFLSDLSLIFGGDSGDGEAGPPSVARLAKAVRGIERYDGLRIRSGPASDEEGKAAGRPAYRTPDFRIAGRASARVRVVGGRSRA